MAIKEIRFNNNEYGQIWLNGVKIWEKLSGSGGSTGGISNPSDTALTQQYSSSHEATPNIANPPTGSYNWKYAPRINPDGSFPNSTWNAFGHWMTTYKIEGASYYDNVGLLLQNPKAWIWNTSTRSWDVLSSDFEWGSWYLEDFYDDGNSTIANSITWEVGASGNHSTWVKIKQDSTTQGRCFHPWGYQKNWRSNSAWSNNGQPYIVTKIDFKLVKYDENGIDNLDNAQLVVNSGGDWWSDVGAVWQPDWSTNRDMCVGKYIKATRKLKRAWATNLPSSWSYGLPMDDEQSSGGGSTGGSAITIETANQGFNPDGSLDGKTTFTHTETYIPFDDNIDKIIKFGVEGWTRAIFYDSNKNRIGYTDSSGAISSLSMSELKTKYANAVYVRVSINQTTTITLVSGSGTILETANQGFNPDGSLDGNTKFTHTETYIPFNGNTNKKVEFVVEGWTRAIFYDSDKNRIGYTDSASAVTYLSMSELQSISPNAVYVRISINKATTIALTDDETIITSPTDFDFSQENAIEYGNYGDLRTPAISRAGYSKVTITTEVAGYIGIIMFSNETTIMASYDDNYREIGTFSITIPTDTCTYVAVKFAPSMIGHISAKLEV